MKSVYCNSNKLTALNISGCYKITTIDCCYNQIGALNTASLTSLSILRCESNLLTSLDASDCGKLKILRCQKNKITAEITEWFDNIFTFEYDRRYTNYRKDYSEDVNGKLVYKDNGVGWWYPGEPDKGYHKRD
jgi:hypothetical protein